jgi:hypothetical protein
MNDLRPRPRQTDLLLRHRFRPNNLLLIGVGGSDVHTLQLATLELTLIP